MVWHRETNRQSGAKARLPCCYAPGQNTGVSAGSLPGHHTPPAEPWEQETGDAGARTGHPPMVAFARSPRRQQMWSAVCPFINLPLDKTRALLYNQFQSTNAMP